MKKSFLIALHKFNKTLPQPLLPSQYYERETTDLLEVMLGELVSNAEEVPAGVSVGKGTNAKAIRWM